MFINNKLIYHYCSVDTLYSIIKYKKLWLTDGNYMNDKYETIWIDKVVCEILEDLKKDQNTYSLEDIENYKNEYEKIEYKKHYMMCFSKEPDMLSQWRGYGDNAKGVSIGFNLEDAGFEYIQPSVNFSIYNTLVSNCMVKLGYQEVDYDERRLIEEEMKKTISESKKGMELTASVNIVKAFSSQLKHKYFEEENEVRLVYTPENSSALNPKSLVNLSELKVRIQNSNIIPYYEFDFEDKTTLIKDIILGSKCKINTDDLKEFLDSENFHHVTISKSTSPYK